MFAILPDGPDLLLPPPVIAYPGSIQRESPPIARRSCAWITSGFQHALDGDPAERRPQRFLVRGRSGSQLRSALRPASVKGPSEGERTGHSAENPIAGMGTPD